MYREQRIRSIKELRERLEALDEDEGIRIYGDAEGFSNGGFLFAGVYMGRYCIRICDRVWSRRCRKYLARRRSEYLYFARADQAWAFIKSAVKRPLKAWLY
ncbi:MAG: hypothetical protein QW390_03000 [Candidatus Bathyarchaeia archaeon]